MREQRDQCGPPARSPFHGAFARPAVPRPLPQLGLYIRISSTPRLNSLWLRPRLPSLLAHLLPVRQAARSEAGCVFESLRAAFPTRVSRTAADCSARYCLAAAASPSHHEALPSNRPAGPQISSFGALTFQSLCYLCPKGLSLKPYAAPMPPTPPPASQLIRRLPVTARPPSLSRAAAGPRGHASGT